MSKKISGVRAVFDKWILEDAVERGMFSSVEEAEPFFVSTLKKFYKKNKNVVDVVFV